MAFGLLGRAPGFAAFDVPRRRLQLGIVGGGGQYGNAGARNERRRHAQGRDPILSHG